jgi:hypothetical protein
MLISHARCPIWAKLGARYLRTVSSGICQLRKNRQTEGRDLFLEVNEITFTRVLQSVCNFESCVGNICALLHELQHLQSSANSGILFKAGVPNILGTRRP